MRYFIYLSYLGQTYHGWQAQKNSHTLQSVVEERLTRLLGAPTNLVASSRTDKGVHASQQVVHVDISLPIHTQRFLYQLNKILPNEISATAIYPVVEGAHARFDGLYRVYEYTIVEIKNPHCKDTAAWVYNLPLLDELNHLSKIFIQQTDFEWFSKKNKHADTFVCHIRESYWFRQNEKTIFRIKANRFLRGMVRCIVGSILKAAKNQIGIERLKALINKQLDHKPPLWLVPAKGLSLVEVGYCKKIFL